MIVGELLRSRIERFLEHVDEPYVKVENVSLERRIRTGERYIPRIISLADHHKMDIMQVLEESWDRNQNHGNVRRWGRAARGVAEYLLMPIEMDQVELDAAADVVVRVSRWFHTNPNCGLWMAFMPYVRRVVELTWGDIEQLYEEQE